MDDIRHLVQDDVQELVSKAVANLVGRRLSHSVESLSTETAIGERTIKAYRSFENVPELSNFLKLSYVLGPDFVNEVLGVIGMQASWTKGAAITAEETTLGLSDLLQAILHRLHDDGKFCHVDKEKSAPDMRKLGNLLIATANEWDGTSGALKFSKAGSVD